MANRIPTALIGAAGVHYVAAELSRTGIIALPTVRNTTGYDLIATSQDGKRHANIQVKTSLRNAGFWLMPEKKRIPSGSSDFFVFLRWSPKRDSFEGFLVSGKEVKRKLREFPRKNSTFRSVYVKGRGQDNQAKWSSNWLRRKKYLHL